MGVARRGPRGAPGGQGRGAAQRGAPPERAALEPAAVMHLGDHLNAWVRLYGASQARCPAPSDQIFPSESLDVATHAQEPAEGLTTLTHLGVRGTVPDVRARRTRHLRARLLAGHRRSRAPDNPTG